MCSQYSVNVRAEQLKNLGINVGAAEDINQRFLPYTKVPVVVLTQQTLKLVAMNFSLVPSWSKEAKAKFATHNARLETLSEKPAWREPFLTKHCLIPMTHFFESVYEGPHAGHIISFSESDKLLFAAGLFDVWTNPETKEQIFSCAIITTTPSPFILENGHDRTPIFLDFKNGQKWLSLLTTPQEMTDFLISKNVYPDLRVTRDRPLKSGWEKRK